jgi:hypothetical protein
MLNGRKHENRASNAVARMPRGSRGVQAFRRRNEVFALRAPLHDCTTRTRIQKEIAQESESARTQAQDQPFGLGPRFPRHGLVDRFGPRLLAGQFGVSQPLADDLAHREVEAISISQWLPVSVLPVVVAERLFVQIAKQVEGFNRYVGAMQTAFKEAPEVLHGVGVDVFVHILDGVVDNRVLVVRLQTIVGKQFVGKDRGTSLDVLANVFLEFLLSAALDHEGSNFPAALDHAHGDGLVFSASAGNYSRTLRLMHIARFAADHTLVNFNFAGKLPSVVSLVGEPHTVQHKPRGLLSNSQVAANFIAGDSILAICNQPHAGKPFIQAKGRVFKDRSDLDGELTLWMADAALPPQLILEEANLGATADRADYTVSPFGTASDEVVKTVLLVREVNDSFLQCLGVVSGFHNLSLPQKRVLRKYVIAPLGNKSQLFMNFVGPLSTVGNPILPTSEQDRIAVLPGLSPFG